MHTNIPHIDRTRAEKSQRRALSLAFRWPHVALAVALAALGFAATAGSAAAAPPNGSGNYEFNTIDNTKDLTFNQLLGINDSGLISGYFGSGEPGHPNKGYLLSPPYGQTHYASVNFPKAAQTQVTGLNSLPAGTNIEVGFWADKENDNFGWYATAHHNFQTVVFPAKHGKPAIDQLLGVNNSDVTVGFYTDANEENHGYTFEIATKTFHNVLVSGDTNVTAAAINNGGDVAGFATNSSGVTEAFLERANGHVTKLDFPGATATQAFGLSGGDEVVGSYTVGEDTHGFVWVPGFGFQTVNDPSGENHTTINGINDHGELVGFYEDASGNTDGLLAVPTEED